MKSVLLRAPVLTESGYGVHARQLAKWLLSRPVNLSIQALPWGDTPWIVNPDRENGLIKQIMDRTNVVNKMHDISFQLQLPNEWDTTLALYNVGVTAAVETDRCNPEWIAACNKMNCIVVPSEHTKKVLINTSNVNVPIYVIPESFSDNLLSDNNKPLELNLETKFNFLIFGQVTGNNPNNDRKNIFYTIKWLCETFKNDPDIGIIVKTNFGRMTKIDKKLCTDTFTKMLKEVKKTSNPKFYLLHGMMSDEDVAGLYKNDKVKALVSLTRGEGFGLPLLEAAASGLPVIATNWSGHLDFMNLGKFINVDYSLKEVDQTRVDNKIFMKGSKWAEVIEEDFKKRILKFRNNPSTPTEWAKELSLKIKKDFSFNEISKKWDSTFRELLT